MASVLGILVMVVGGYLVFGCLDTQGLGDAWSCHRRFLAFTNIYCCQILNYLDPWIPILNIDSS